MPSPSAPLPTVLIADNDAAVSSLLAEVLSRVGLSVQQARDGEEARVMASGLSCSVLVCDLDMPRVPGIEVLETLADPPPTVVISGYIDAAVEARLAALPFVRAVLRKPFDLLAFAERVRGLALGGEAAPGAGSDGALARASKKGEPTLN